MVEQTSLLLLEPKDERWVDFVASNPRAHFFHHPTWTTLMAECYGYRSFVVAVSDGAGRIAAGVSMAEISRVLTGRRWVSLPFTDHVAPLFSNEEALAALTTELVDLGQRSSISEIELRGGVAAHPLIRPIAHYHLHRVRLCADPQQLFVRFDRVHRQNVRRAEKNGMRVEWGRGQDALHQFYELQVATRRRHGVPSQPWRYFEMLANNLFEEGLASILLAYKDNRCLAALLLLHWRHTIVCKYSASRLDSQSLRPNNLLFWTAIRWGCENGYEWFDMGRNELDNPGLRRFKLGWGAEEVPLTYYSLGCDPGHSWRGGLMQVMKPLIQKAPTWVCRAIGESLYGYFG